MKKLPTILIAFLMAIVALTDSASVPAQSDAQISSIRAQYASINKRSARYKKVKKLLSGFSLEGGDLVAYFDGPSIIKMVATHYGEMGRSLEEYYYSNGKLIFVFDKAFHYDKPLGKVVRVAETRYYFNNDQLIRWIDENGKQADITSENARSNHKKLLENSTLFLAGARSKNRTIKAEQ